MKIGFRADAHVYQGTGHIMRCLTLAQELKKLGIEVVFYSNIPEITWLNYEFTKNKIEVQRVQLNSFDVEFLTSQKLDLLIVDSYEIDAEQINFYSASNLVLAIIDGNDRGIFAQIYLDQNFTTKTSSMITTNSFALKLFGANYALIREELLSIKRSKIDTPSNLSDATILCMSGGSDPSQAILSMARIISKLDSLNSIFIAPTEFHENLSLILFGKNYRLIDFTNDLPDLLSSVDAVFSATGTSSWELLTIGIPSAFTITADNQFDSANEINKGELGLLLGQSEFLLDDVQLMQTRIMELLLDSSLRNKIFTNCRKYFDGKGVERVVSAILSYISKE